MAAGKRYKRFAGHSVHNAAYHNENWDRFFDGNALYDVGFDSLADAITYIGTSARKTLYITSKHQISNNTTTPSNISIVRLDGGGFTSSNVSRLTVNGPFSSPDSQAFFGDLLVTFSAREYVKAVWWGTGAAAIQSALDSGTASTVHTVLLLPGSHNSSAITWPTTYQTCLLGPGSSQCILNPQNTDSTRFIYVNAMASDRYIPVMEGFKVQGTSTCGNGIEFDAPTIGPRLKDLWIRDCTGSGKSGLVLKQTFIGVLDSIKIFSCYNGLTLDRGKGIQAIGSCWIADNTNRNIQIINDSGTSNGNNLYIQELGLSAVNATRQAIYCEGYNNTIHLGFFENFTHARSIELTSESRNNDLIIDNASIALIHDSGIGNRVPMGNSYGGHRQTPATEFFGSMAGTGPMTNLFENSSFIDTGSSEFSSITTASNKTGTITTSAASATVTGSGTLFTEELVVGQRITWVDDAAATAVGTIQSITDDEELVLTAVAGSVATAVTFQPTNAPLRAIVTSGGYLDDNSLELDWGTIDDGSVGGAESQQTFSVGVGDFLTVMMMVKPSRDFAADENMKLRIFGASNQNRAIEYFSDLKSDRWTLVMLAYYVETTENVNLFIDLDMPASFSSLKTYHDDICVFVNARSPSLLYNQDAAGSASLTAGMYAPKLSSKDLRIHYGPSSYAPVSGVIDRLATPTNSSSASRQTLHTTTLPKHALHADLKGVRIFVFGRTAANANNKRVYISVGGTDIADTGAAAANDETWHIEALILRRSSSLAQAWSYGDWNATMLQSVRTSLSPTFSSTLDIDFDCECASATGGELVIDGIVVELLP